MSWSSVVLVIFSVISCGLTQERSSFRCSDGWVQLSSEKCYKVIERSATWDEANAICGDGSGAYTAGLLTIKSRVESRILQTYLYRQHYITDPVWIRASRENNTASFGWNDGTAFYYTNWDQNRPSKDEDSNCAQFDPRTTKWTDTSCSRTGVVVCQQLQIWTFPQLLQEFFEWRKVIEEKLEDLEDEIEDRDDKINSLELNVYNLNEKYNSLSSKFSKLSDDLEKKIESAVDKLQDQSDKVSDKVSALDTKTTQLSKDVEELKKQCSKGCSDSGSDDDDDDDDNDNDRIDESQVQAMIKVLREEIEKKLKSLEDKVGDSVTDVRLEIINWRRTLQIERDDEWHSVGYV